MSPETSAMTPMAIAVVALVMTISTAAIIMNSGILMLTYGYVVFMIIIVSEFQIRRGIEDNSKICFLISQRKHML